MPHFGQISGILDGVDGVWLVPLDETGAPALPLTFIPADSLPHSDPVWEIALPIGSEDGVTFTQDEAAELGLLQMRRRMAERRGGHRS